MTLTIERRAQIPDAYCYVLANDSFMSGWGLATGMTNTIILPCESFDEAKVVEKNARARSEMRHVRIAWNKPRMRDHVLYSLMNREDAERWYTPHGFCRDD